MIFLDLFDLKNRL